MKPNELALALVKNSKPGWQATNGRNYVTSIADSLKREIGHRRDL
jgi:hypothetical protein